MNIKATVFHKNTGLDNINLLLILKREAFPLPHQIDAIEAAIGMVFIEFGEGIMAGKLRPRIQQWLNDDIKE